MCPLKAPVKDQPSPLLASGGCRQFLASMAFTLLPSLPPSPRGLLSAFVWMSPNLSPYEVQPLGLKPTLIQRDLILADDVCKDRISK